MKTEKIRLGMKQNVVSLFLRESDKTFRDSNRGREESSFLSDWVWDQVNLV